MSAPPPPINVSFPPLPMMMSFPGPPTSVSAFVLPKNRLIDAMTEITRGIGRGYGINMDIPFP